ncbi:MAG: hypothetical protein KBC17_02870 [Candidatus Pacebacteria bacterium]|nr:hypothetical protein [Candidatus Paceibacterota bacterium]
MKPTSSKKLWKIGQKEYNTQYFDFNKDGDLIIKEGHNIYNVRYLAEKMGTPLQILMPFVVEERLEDFLDLNKDLSKKIGYQGKFFYHYPMKVNQNKEVIMALVGEGAHLETSSYNDLYLIKKMLEQEKFNPNIRIMCNGPKTDKYLNLIDELQHKGTKIFPLIEGPNELKVLQHSRYDVGVRLAMNDVKVNSRWKKPIDRFGFPANEILAMDKFKNLKILHYHIGGQIETLNDIIAPIKYALDVYCKLKEKNPSLDTLDIGGGMPIPFLRTKTYPIDKLMEKIFALLKTESEKRGIPHPNLICEWGSYMVYPSQITIYKVIDTKKIVGKKPEANKWYVVDGSFMNDLCDTWAIGQKWAMAPANNKGDKNLNEVWLAGSTCDSDDTYKGVNGSVTLPDYDYDEQNPMYVVVFDTGGYQASLSMHHCLLSAPLKVIAENGHIVVARKRETPEDVGKEFGW